MKSERQAILLQNHGHAKAHQKAHQADPNQCNQRGTQARAGPSKIVSCARWNHGLDRRRFFRSAGKDDMARRLGRSFSFLQPG